MIYECVVLHHPTAPREATAGARGQWKHQAEKARTWTQMARVQLLVLLHICVHTWITNSSAKWVIHIVNIP